MRLSKEEFIKLVGEYIDMVEDKMFVADIMNRNLSLSGDAYDLLMDCDLAKLFFRTLEVTMDDTEHWIKWWVGQKFDEIAKTGRWDDRYNAKAGERISLKDFDTVEALYDFLAEHYEYKD